MPSDPPGKGWRDVLVFGEKSKRATIRPSVYALMQNSAGELAVVRTSEGEGLPGGGLKFGESPEEALVREVREECGLEIRAGECIAQAVQFEDAPSHAAHYEKRSSFMVAELVGPSSTPPKEGHVLSWLSPEVAAATVTRESHAWAIQMWSLAMKRLQCRG